MDRATDAPASSYPAQNGWRQVFVQNGSLLMGSNLVQAVAAFISQLILMRLLSPTDFGGFALVLVSATLVQVVLSPRLGVLVIRARESEYTEAFRGRLYSAMTIEALVSLAVMMASVTVAGIRSPWAYVLVVTLAAAHWVGSVTTFYERGLPYRQVAAIETSAQLAAHGLAVALAIGGAGVASLYLREAFLVAFRAGWLARIGAIPRWPLRRVTRSEWRGLLTEARVPWLDGIFDGGFQRLTVLAAGALGGVHGAGLFFQAQRLALVPHQVLSPVVVRLAGNVFSRIDEPHVRRRTLIQVLTAVTVPLAAAAVGAWVFADPVVPWLFGEEWREAGDVLSAMAGMVLGFSLFELGRVYCLTQRRNWLLVAGRVVQYAVFTVGCLLVLDGGTAAALGAVQSAVFIFAAGTLFLGLAAARGRI
jgi:O-antigen/teichoic acid export membrane protein